VPADQPLERGDPGLVGGEQFGSGDVLVEGTRLGLLDQTRITLRDRLWGRDSAGRVSPA
jgi:hypothetical protein